MSTPYLKPQVPLYDKKQDAYFYPLTVAHQVVMPSGKRLDETSAVPDETLSEAGLPADAAATGKILTGQKQFDRIALIDQTTHEVCYIFANDGGLYYE